ncbi:MAG: RIP metalloprotease RseP [Gammaproteobacteria bacterium]|nr:RIP metalloprotease RseP [Gammaproteobacteria bacterium]
MFESALAYPLAFLIAIGILVTVHEYGHYQVARWCGVRVLRFSVGFGRPLLRWQGKNGGTEYTVGMIPLGGYVRMLDSTEDAVPVEERHEAFDQKSVTKRIAVTVAGPGANFLFAILAYWAMYTIGTPALAPIIGKIEPQSVAAEAGVQPGSRILAVGDRPVQSWGDARLALLRQLNATGEATLETELEGRTRRQILLLAAPLDPDAPALLTALGITPFRPEIAARLGALTAGGPADLAGLHPGDEVLVVSGTVIRNWQDWVDVVRASPGIELEVEINRAGQRQRLTVTPESYESAGQGRLGRVGVRAAEQPGWPEGTLFQQRYPLHTGWLKAVDQTYSQTSFTLWFLGRMVTGNAALSNLSGPVTIAKYAGETARMGSAPFLEFLALVSISLGILNLLPVPVLDGGHLVYYCAEAIRRKPLSEGVRMAGQQGGVVVLLGLTAIALYNDLVRLFS